MSNTRDFNYQLFRVEHDNRTKRITKKIDLDETDTTAIEHTNYVAKHEKLNIGVAAFLNTRGLKSHTSRVLANTIEHAECKTWGNRVWHDLLKKTFVALADKVKNATSGASMCAGFFSGKNLYIANIGINHIYRITLGKSTTIELLNHDILHTPANESIRLKRFAFTQSKDFNLLVPTNYPDRMKLNDRLAGSLKLSRAFGYTNYVADGMFDEVDIKHVDLSTTDECQSFILIASASLTNHKQNAEDRIKSIIRHHKDKSAGAIAQELALGIQDNLLPNTSHTVCVIPVNAREDMVKYAALIKSHENKETADVIYQELDITLQKQINAMYHTSKQPAAFHSAMQTPETDAKPEHPTQSMEKASL